MYPSKITDAFLVTLLHADSKRLPPEVILEAIDRCPWITNGVIWADIATADLQYCSYTVRQGLQSRAIPILDVTDENVQNAQGHLWVDVTHGLDVHRLKGPVWRWHHNRTTGDDAQDLILTLRDNFGVDIALLHPKMGLFAVATFCDRAQSWNDATTGPVKCDLGRGIFQSRTDFLDWGIGILENGFSPHEDDGLGACTRCGVPRGEVEQWNKHHPEPWLQRRFSWKYVSPLDVKKG